MSLYIIYDYFYPAYKAGGPIQSLLNLVDHLQDELDIRVICSSKDHDGTELPVKYNEWTITQDKNVFYTTKGFKGVQAAVGETNPVFFINGMYSIDFSFRPALSLKGRKIVSVRGMLHPGGLSQKSIKKKIYLFTWKMLGLHRRCEYHATNVEEKEHIEKVFGTKTKVWVAPNLPHALSKQELPSKQRGHLILCTVALISPMKNHLLVLEALMNCNAEVVYHIYGPVKDNEYWNKCKLVISKLPKNITVYYHGELSPDLIPGVLANSQVVIQPSKSENFGHSLYEALTSGLPIITSHHTPWNQLRDENAGYNVSIDTHNELRKALDFFAGMDNEQFQQWSLSARKYALKAIDVEDIRKKYLGMFNNERTISSAGFEHKKGTISYI